MELGCHNHAEIALLAQVQKMWIVPFSTNLFSRFLSELKTLICKTFKYFYYKRLDKIKFCIQNWDKILVTSNITNYINKDIKILEPNYDNREWV